MKISAYDHNGELIGDCFTDLDEIEDVLLDGQVRKDDTAPQVSKLSISGVNLDEKMVHSFNCKLKEEFSTIRILRR